MFEPRKWDDFAQNLYKEKKIYVSLDMIIFYIITQLSSTSFASFQKLAFMQNVSFENKLDLHKMNLQAKHIIM